ncbi:MAG: bifunctional oligoribonuclease/PAP phosphatase NrnA [Firmicutes bacterium]|nr:bifunctional oligoribonuclease/PAP phosphatase NrnA [Bacillota bacterium]
MDEIIDVLRKSKSIVVLPHIQADGDALGSGLALALALSRINSNVMVYLEEDMPQMYSFLPGQEMVAVFPDSIEVPDTVVAIDTGDIERLGNRASLFKSVKFTINIDHHPTNTHFADFNYVCSNSSAAGEIIYQLINMMGLVLDADISTCLYVAIITDTGGFRFANTTYITHLVASDLLNNGINVTEISAKVFDSISIEKVKLIGAAISSLELLEDGRIAFITVTEKMMQETGARDEECEGIVNLGRNIHGVEIAVLFREKKEEVKVSLRSNSDIDVSIIAGSFAGGGHKKAAGCTIKGNLHDVKEKILVSIVDALKS